MSNRYELRQYGAQLWTRELAKQIRDEVEEKLEALQPGETLVIDASGVEVFDFSFANELFGRLIHTMPTAFPGCFLVVEGLKPYARENLEKALESIGLAIVERRQRKMTIIGKAGPTDEETFEVVAKARKPISAAELAARLDVNATAMNERLSKLVRLGLIHRSRAASPAGREQYAYSAPR